MCPVVLPMVLQLILLLNGARRVVRCTGAGQSAGSAVRDVHRDFKSKTQVGKFRFAPSHDRSPCKVFGGMCRLHGLRANPGTRAVEIIYAKSVPTAGPVSGGMEHGPAGAILPRYAMISVANPTQSALLAVPKMNGAAKRLTHLMQIGTARCDSDPGQPHSTNNIAGHSR